MDSAIHARAAAAADRLCGYPFRVWGYGDSVGFEGLLAASSVLDDPGRASFVYGLIKGWVPRAKPFVELDNTAPGHAICLSEACRHDQSVLDAAEQLVAFLTARPLIEGCFQSFHVAPLKQPFGGGQLSSQETQLLSDPGPGVFVDCLHFDAPFLTHLGKLVGRDDLVDCGAGQAVAMVRLLQDESGVFSHFYLPKTRERYGYGWSRGQGWALLGLLDVLDQLPADHSARPELERAALALGRALVATQDASGHWPALVHESDVFLETSAAYFFAAGLTRGIKSGLFPVSWADCATTAFSAGVDAVSRDGTIEGVSAEIWACTSLEHYRRVPTGFQVPWGQGAFLIAVDEIARDL
ncbi:MAG TPA: glycoside hydrolase family 88 protein [Gaiellaceae bacterium]|nr:glycoside hydrolase family 88 protein [Gaiellaceae bacterium]